jgi:hypothetical protein
MQKKGRPRTLAMMASVEDEAATKPSVTPKKRFIGKARAEALRKKASEQRPPNIEDGQVTLKGMCILYGVL